MTQGAHQSAMKFSDKMATTWPFRMAQGMWSRLHGPW
jgi:hypothetical protein